MSLILIGFGKKTRKELRQTAFVQRCVWCSVETVYQLVRVRTWFTYFFIPVIPYSREYQFVCPECGRFIVISKNEAKAANRGELMIRREFIS